MKKYEDVKTTQYGNTGASPNAINYEEIVAMIIGDEAISFTTANMADDLTFMGVLQTKTSAALKENRLYPLVDVPVFDSVTDNTGDTNTEISDNGNFRGTNKPNIMLRFLLNNKGGAHLHQQICRYELNKNVGVAFIMKNGLVVQKKVSTGSKLMPAQIIPQQPKAATGSAAVQYQFDVMLKEEDALSYGKVDLYPFASLTTITDNLRGVKDLELSQVAVAATTATIKAVNPANYKNIGDDYSTQVAAAGAWVVKNKATNATVTPSGVTYSAVTGGFTLAGLTTATTYIITMADPAALIALNVGTAATGGYESNSIEVTTS